MLPRSYSAISQLSILVVQRPGHGLTAGRCHGENVVSVFTARLRAPLDLLELRQLSHKIRIDHTLLFIMGSEMQQHLTWGRHVPPAERGCIGKAYSFLLSRTSKKA